MEEIESPFTENTIEADMTQGIRLLKDRYNGTPDPQDSIAVFKVSMKVAQATDEDMC